MYHRDFAIFVQFNLSSHLQYVFSLEKYIVNSDLRRLHTESIHSTLSRTSAYNATL
jgi:hypothetical protein